MKMTISKTSQFYLGIESDLDIYNILNRKQLEAFLSILNNDGEIDLNKGNLSVLNNIRQELLNANIVSEILVFAEKNIEEIPSFDRIGFDISGNSLHFSPLFSGLHSLSTNPLLKTINRAYKQFLNHYGLFDDNDIASEYSELTIYLNSIVNESFFENDDSIRPISVFKYIYRY